MKYTKILQRDLDFNMSPEHAQELRAQAQELQLKVQDYFSQIKDLNQKIGLIIHDISQGKVVKTCKCIEEIDIETKMVKVFYNGQPIEVRPMSDDDISSLVPKDPLLKQKQLEEKEIAKYPPTPSPVDPKLGYALDEVIDNEFLEGDNELSII